MSSEETLIQVRQDKHQQLNGGHYSLATSVCQYDISGIRHLMSSGYPKTTIQMDDVKDDPQYTVHGRITAFRKSGGISFVKLTDISGSMQLIANRAFLSDYGNLPLLDLGDLIEVQGWPVLSQTGEQSILINQWRLLTKAHRPPPEKFFGLSNSETIYRQRYLDLLSSEESRARFTLRSLIVRGLRKIMDGHNFLEMETATLNSISSGANAKPFITHHNALDADLFLRIAPELQLKRLLVGGFEKVYEIGRAYRNEGIDTRHNPEFTLMEAYQAYTDFPQLVSLTKSILEDLDVYLESETRGLVRQYYHQWKAARPFTLNQFATVSMVQAVELGCRKASLSLNTNNPTASGFPWPPAKMSLSDDILSVECSVPEAVRYQQIDIAAMQADLAKCTTPGAKWAVLFEYVAEPFLTEDYRTEDRNQSVPVFITEYPKEVSPLARHQDHNSMITDRFELFVEGRELANAFQELNDPKEQALRFREQLETNQKDPMAYDADYIQALEYGMPPACGLGIGIDRLVMLLTGTTSIKDVILFPTLRLEK